MPNISPRVEPFLTAQWEGVESDCIMTFNAQSVGISGGQRGTVNETATHVINVLDHWDDIREGDSVTIISDWHPPEHMIVIDFEPTPVGVILYARREDRVMIDPEVAAVMVEP